MALEKGQTLQRRMSPGRPSKLSHEQFELLPSLWSSRAKWTMAQFAQAIYEATGVRYDSDHVGRLIIRLGLRVKRFRRQPSQHSQGYVGQEAVAV